MTSPLDSDFRADDHPLHAQFLAVGFGDPVNAWHLLQRIGRQPETHAILVRCLPHLFSTLARTANPDRALLNLDRLMDAALAPAELLGSLAKDVHTLDLLVILFAGSQFLSEIVIRRPEHLTSIQDQQYLTRRKSAEEFQQEARWVCQSCGPADFMSALRRFQRLELLRIGLSDLAGLLPLPVVTVQLSLLADSLVCACLERLADEMGMSLDTFAVIALGKLGGSELNYSSDIDLLFLATEDTLAHERLGRRLIDALARITAEGFLYRVDMRLRPWGRVGPLVSSIDGYMTYLRKHARLWEKQVLLKARAIAGNTEMGRQVLEDLAPLIYELPPELVRHDVHQMKQRIEAQLSEQGREWGEVKLGKGSIRDVEFVVQYLQLAYGDTHPQIRSHNTLDALSRLASHGLLTTEEFRILADGYAFLRPVEHLLQMMDHRQTHLLPNDPKELDYLARRLGFQGDDAGALFVARYEQHSAAIRHVYCYHLESRETRMTVAPDASDTALGRHLARMAPSYGAAFSEEEIRRHAELADQLDEDTLVQVDVKPLDARIWQVTIVGYDYPGELSVICGLLFVHGFSIEDGHVFTYEPEESAPNAWSPMGQLFPQSRMRRKIVDVLNVRSVLPQVSPDVWSRYAADLAALLARLQDGQQAEVQGELAKRVAVMLRDLVGAVTTLHPVTIEIDNDISDKYTVLRIEAADTMGFLYEFTSALALNGVYIAEVNVTSRGHRAYDTLYLTDAHGRKITSPDKQRELRAATVLVKHFTHLLPQSPNPEAALAHFGQFLNQLFRQSDWPEQLGSLERPEVLGALARLLGVSDFLWEDFLRMQYANLFPVVRDVDALSSAKGKDQMRAELMASLQDASDSQSRRSALNAFKDREMFRVDMRHIMGHVRGFWQFSRELTDLAEIVVEAAHRCCERELLDQYGTPCLDNGYPSSVTICALGKCGGRELGFASDIELMFIYAGNGQTAGPQVITTAEFYEKLVIEFIAAIRAKREGIFEVDLQLRPYGRAGSMAVSLDSFCRYFGPQGPAWPYERQALIKLRPIAGDMALGTRLLTLRDEYVYQGSAFDVAAMRAMRQRQLMHLVTAGTINAKYSPGGLVDVEYLVQGLQLKHGRDHASVRLANTRESIVALRRAGILTGEETRQLRGAHAFARRLIDALRMVRGNAKDLAVPSPDSEEFVFLAQRLGYGADRNRLREDLARNMKDVQALSLRLLGDGGLLDATQ